VTLCVSNVTMPALQGTFRFFVSLSSPFFPPTCVCFDTLVLPPLPLISAYGKSSGRGSGFFSFCLLISVLFFLSFGGVFLTKALRPPSSTNLGACWAVGGISGRDFGGEWIPHYCFLTFFTISLRGFCFLFGRSGGAPPSVGPPSGFNDFLS